MPEDPALEIRDLKFRYRGARRRDPWTVDVPHLRLGGDEQILLTGGSGRGKSTLLYLISGMLNPRSGKVRIAGRRIHALSGAARDRFRGEHVGMIFQTFNLLHGFSSLENVMAALMFSSIPRNQHSRRARKLLRELGIEHARRSPDQMSIGQQQRVAVARALACKPVIVLADEPTASLDPENAATAMDLIQQTCADHGAALLVTSHDPAMVERFPRRVSLDELALGDEGAHAPAVAPAPLPDVGLAPERADADDGDEDDDTETNEEARDAAPSA